MIYIEIYIIKLELILGIDIVLRKWVIRNKPLGPRDFREHSPPRDPRSLGLQEFNGLQGSSEI